MGRVAWLACGVLAAAALAAAVDVSSALRHRERQCCGVPQCPQPCGTYIAGTVTTVVHDLPRTVIDASITAPPAGNSTLKRRRARKFRNNKTVTASVKQGGNSTGGIVSPVIVPRLGGLANVPVLEYDACQQSWVLRCRTLSVASLRSSCMQQIPQCGSPAGKAPPKRRNETKGVKRAKDKKIRHKDRLTRLKEREARKEAHAKRLAAKTKAFKHKLEVAEKTVNSTKKRGRLTGASLDKVVRLSKEVLRNPDQLRKKADELRKRAKKLLDQAAQLESSLGKDPKTAVKARNKIQVLKIRSNNLNRQAKALDEKAAKRSKINEKINKAKGRARNATTTNKAKPLIAAAIMIRKTAEKAAAKGHPGQARKLKKKAMKLEKKAIKNTGHAKPASISSVTTLLAELSKKDLNTSHICNKMIVIEHYLKKKEKKKVGTSPKKKCAKEVQLLGGLNKALTSFCKKRKTMKPKQLAGQIKSIKKTTKDVVDAQKACRAASVPRPKRAGKGGRTRK